MTLRLAESHEALEREWAHFHAQWDRASETWNDAIAAEFKKTFVTESESRIPSLLRTLELLDVEAKRTKRLLSDVEK